MDGFDQMVVDTATDERNPLDLPAGVIRTIKAILADLAAARQGAETWKEAARVEANAADVYRGQLDSAREEVRRLREALTDAWSELCQWEQLAKYQREQMDQNLGWCPTEAGIDASVAARGRISDALAEPNPQKRGN